MSAAAPVSEVLELEGALSFESLPGVLAESEKYTARPDLPDKLTIDFARVTTVDSSAVALTSSARARPGAPWAARASGCVPAAS